MEKLVYVFFAIVAVLYAAHLADKEIFSKYAQQLNAGFLSEIFTFIDNYSPFNEALESDEELIEKLRKQAAVKESSTSGIKIYSVEELKKYDGSPGSPGLYIALLGVVYDVAKGAQYYGPGQEQLKKIKSFSTQLDLKYQPIGCKIVNIQAVQLSVQA